MNLKPLFEPRTLAVIGISSANERHPANVIFEKNNQAKANFLNKATL